MATNPRLKIKDSLVLLSLTIAILLFMNVASGNNPLCADWTGSCKDESRSSKSEEIKIDDQRKETTVTQFNSGKTLWDWLHLASSLAIPILLLYLSNKFQRNSQQEAKKNEEREKERLEKQMQLDKDIAAKNLRDEALDKYFDCMSDLLIQRSLKSLDDNNPVTDMARTRTLSILRRLKDDNERKSHVIFFLEEAEVIRIIKKVDRRFIQGIDLSKVDFSGIDLSGIDLSGMILNGANFTGANLNGANFTRANLTEANLTGANLFKTNFSQANLLQANLEKSKPVKADFTEANLCAGNFANADLSGATCYDTTIQEAIFFNANLSEANLSGADFSDSLLYRANFTGANLFEANLNGVNFIKSNLTGANLHSVRCLNNDLSILVRFADHWEKAIYSESYQFDINSRVFIAQDEQENNRIIDDLKSRI